MYKTWLFQNFSQINLFTVTGETLSIIDPGKRNLYEGPDFKDAQVFIDGKLRTGDVEIHISNNDWNTHRHQEDPAYNKVILHVVVGNSSGPVVRTQANKTVPVFIMPACPDYRDADRPSDNEPDHVSSNCSSWTGIDEIACETLLSKYADIRFQRKGLTIKKEIIRKSANHTFYRLILDGLGYSQNRESFKSLADQIPLSKLYTILDQADASGGCLPDKVIQAGRIATLEAILLGTAGFISEPCAKYVRTDSEYFQGIKQNWMQLKRRFELPVMELKWHFAGIRPANFPSRRLIALAQIIHKFYPDEPAQSWSNLVCTHSESKSVINWTRDYFQQPAGMWKNHPLLKNSRGNVLLGSGRIMDMISNLFLPFSWAVASLQNNGEMMDSAMSLSRKIPRGEIPSAINRWKSGFNLSDRFFSRNYLVQGAIEVHHSFCDLELCKLCPLEDYADKQ
ncbi:MAG: DUF2851 family protein [Candidatus Marinimicrobia bacterium]|nr:DUF2851 family protein [Candidatus Neomarinimicrobiota bacterium]